MFGRPHVHQEVMFGRLHVHQEVMFGRPHVHQEGHQQDNHTMGMFPA